jgi:hypothetical protein
MGLPPSLPSVSAGREKQIDSQAKRPTPYNGKPKEWLLRNRDKLKHVPQEQAKGLLTQDFVAISSTPRNLAA